MSQALERFRRLTGSAPEFRSQRASRISKQEWFILLAVIVNLAWFFLAKGGVRFWGESVACIIAIISLLLLPEWKNSKLPFAKKPVGRMLRSPLFWSGLGLYFYMLIQAYNPQWAWTIYPDGRPRVVYNADYIKWLPSGITAPLDDHSPIRSIIFFTTPWLTAVVIWCGLNSRKALNILLHSTAIMGLSFAVIALVQHSMDVKKVLWMYETTKGHMAIPFWGALVNENHASFYLILINGLCLGLFLHGWNRNLRKLRGGGGFWLLYLGFAIIISFSTLMAQSRGAIIILVFEWLIFISICAVFFVRKFGKLGILLTTPFLVGVVGLISVFIINPSVFERQQIEWKSTFDLKENPEAEARYYMFQICADMIVDQPWLGHGAGSFMFKFFPYKAKYPEFENSVYRWIKDPHTQKWKKVKKVVWFKNAHTDLLEYIVEWGIIGSLFPLMGIFYLLFKVITSRKGWDYGLLMIFFGLSLLVLGALVEFHFRIPLVLLTWVTIYVALTKIIVIRHRSIVQSNETPS